MTCPEERSYPCLNPFNFSVEELGPLAIQDHTFYALLMYPDVILEKVMSILPSYIERKRISMEQYEIWTFATEITIKLLELPLEDIRLILKFKRALRYHFVVAYQQLTN